MKQPGFLTMCRTKSFYIFFSSKTKEWKQQLHIAQTLSFLLKGTGSLFSLANCKPFLLSLHTSSESLGEKSQPIDESGFPFLTKMQKGASKQRVTLSGSEKGSILIRKWWKWNVFCHEKLCLLVKSVKYSAREDSQPLRKRQYCCIKWKITSFLRNPICVV